MRRLQRVVYMVGFFGARMSTDRTTVCPGATLTRRPTTGLSCSLAPAVYVNSTLPGYQTALPVLVTFHPVVKLSLGLYVMPLPGDCQFNRQSNSSVGVAVGYGEEYKTTNVGQGVRVGVVDGPASFVRTGGTGDCVGVAAFGAHADVGVYVGTGVA